MILSDGFQQLQMTGVPASISATAALVREAYSTEFSYHARSSSWRWPTLLEVANYAGGGVWMTIAQFRQDRDMLLVDLRDLPEVPSLFDLTADMEVIEIPRFVDDLTQPTRLDDYQNLG